MFYTNTYRLLPLQDVITDLVCERGSLNAPGLPDNAWAHNGILQSALFLQKTLQERRILEDAWSRAPVRSRLTLVIGTYSVQPS